MQLQNLNKLKYLLEQTHAQFVETNEIQSDALAPALIYKNPIDQEFAAYICSILAYGRVQQIKSSISKILNEMGPEPVRFLIQSRHENINKITQNWKHRFNTSRDIQLMLMTLKQVYNRHGSIENFINPNFEMSARALICCFNQKLYEILKKDFKIKAIPKSFYFFIPDPIKGGACKRMNLYLKWMVRDEKPDLGIWKKFSKKNLIIPLDTHIYKQAKALKFTKQKSANWKTAEEITEQLRRLDPADPTRYDFALCHLGMKGYILSDRLNMGHV